jgi:N-acetylglutamate synthase-like GNAT family acetyltransferase
MLDVAQVAANQKDITVSRPLQVREAAPADRDRLWEFVTVSGLEAAGVLEPGTRFWLVENAVGRIVASTGIEYGPAAVLFRSTAVDPAYRRRGLALALYELRFSVAMAEGFRVAYGFCDTPGFMLRTGWRAVPVAELVEALPKSHQVAHFARIGWLPTEHAFRRDLATRWEERELQ